jgi:PKD repeat protein
MPLPQRILSTTVLGLLLCTLAVFGSQPAQAAKPPPTPLSCSILPADGSVTVGATIEFTGSTQGGKGGKSYSWDFSDGPGSPSSSTSNPVGVTYSNIGTYNVRLDVSDKSGDASCPTTVIVTGGGVNTAPVAQPDNFSTNEDTVLNGNVLADNGNGVDYDPDDDAISVSAFDATSTQGASVAISLSGALTYDPTAAAAAAGLERR